MKFVGSTAVVTGAGSGIGRSLARLLAERGATVHVVDVNRSAAETTATEIGGTAHTVDVTDAEAVERLAADVFRAGPLDLLFNNAGIGHAGAVVDTTLDDWRALIDVNLMGVVHGLHAFLPRLLAQDRPAHIMNTASMAGLVPAAGLAAYSATKAAVVALTDALDIELIGTPVRVSALCPGVIDTAIVGTSRYARRLGRSAYPHDGLLREQGHIARCRGPASAGRNRPAPADRADAALPDRPALGAQAHASPRRPGGIRSRPSAF